MGPKWPKKCFNTRETCTVYCSPFEAFYYWVERSNYSRMSWSRTQTPQPAFKHTFWWLSRQNTDPTHQTARPWHFHTCTHTFLWWPSPINMMLHNDTLTSHSPSFSHCLESFNPSTHSFVFYQNYHNLNWSNLVSHHVRITSKELSWFFSITNNYPLGQRLGGGGGDKWVAVIAF